MILVFIIAICIGLSIPNLHTIALKPFLLLSSGFIAVHVIVCTAAFIFLRKRHRRLFGFVFTITFAVIAFILGFSRVYFFNREYLARTNIISTHNYISGKVKSEPQLSKSRKSFCFLLDVYTAANRDETVSFDKCCLIKLYVAKDKLPRKPEIGNTISCNINLDMMSKPSFTGDLDMSKFLLQSKAAYNGYSSTPEFSEPLSPRGGIVEPIENAGLALRKRILKSAEIFPYGEDERALLRGILVGDKSEFDDSLYEDYQSSGFSHITSVSGMHTSYLFMLLAALLGFIRLPKKAVSIIAAPIMLTFAAVALFTPSVCRAVIMTLFVLFAATFNRKGDSITALSFAALLLTANNPYCLESVSFLLSFGATLGILVFYKPLRKILARPNKNIFNLSLLSRILHNLRRVVKDSVILSVSATIGVAYFLAKFFGRLQWGAIFGNIIIFPLTAVAFIGGYINFGVSEVLPKLAYIIAEFVINPTLRLINSVAEFYARRIFSFSVPSPSDLFFAVYVLICAAFYMLLMPSEDRNTLVKNL